MSKKIKKKPPMKAPGKKKTPAMKAPSKKKPPAKKVAAKKKSAAKISALKKNAVTKKSPAKKKAKAKSAKIKKTKVATTKQKVLKTTTPKTTASKPKVTPSKMKVATAAHKETPKVHSEGLKLGQVVPDLERPSTDGTFSFNKYRGKKIVLFFYPKDHTPGCTLEGHDFTMHLEEFKKRNTVVFGVSRDSLSSHQKFIEKQNYKHNLISDVDEKLCQAFGVIKEKSMYGRTYWGVDRSTFIIDSNGTLVAQWSGVKVNGHVQEVIAKLAEIK